MTPYRLTIHCSDTPNGQPFTVNDIRSGHLERGWADIGYHFVIETDGALRTGRAFYAMGAHVSGENQGNIGICLVGRDRFSRAQFETLNVVLETCQATGIRTHQFYLHRDFPSARAQSKTCPNIPMRVILTWFFERDPAAIASYLLS